MLPGRTEPSALQDLRPGSYRYGKPHSSPDRTGRLHPLKFSKPRDATTVSPRIADSRMHDHQGFMVTPAKETRHFGPISANDSKLANPAER